MKRRLNQEASTSAGNVEKRWRLGLDVFTPHKSTGPSEDCPTQGSSLEAPQHLRIYQASAESLLASRWTSGYSDSDRTDSDANGRENSATNSFDVEKFPYSPSVQETLGPMVWKPDGMQLEHTIII